MNKNQVTEIINHLKQRGYVCCEDNLLAFKKEYIYIELIEKYNIELDKWLPGFIRKEKINFSEYPEYGVKSVWEMRFDDYVFDDYKKMLESMRKI